MTSSKEQQLTKTDSNKSLKLAIAMALLRSKQLQKPPTDLSSESDAQRWKRKAKDRKQELLRLKQDLKEAEDGSQYDLFPQSASCKCYLFDNLGKLSPKLFGDGCDGRFNDVLRRRFLRQVRFKERRRRRTDGSVQRPCFSDLNGEDETEQLRASVDFLVELCITVSPVEEANFANWSHQAVDFILEICHSDSDAQFYVQHLIRKLGSEHYVGQRTVLSVSQRISVLAESLLFMDPFDDAFPNMHSCMFVMIQLIEFLVLDYLSTWSRDGGFDSMLFEEWVTSVLHARKALELLESRNGLYVLYMDRVMGELAKQVGQVSSLQKLNPDIIDNLFR